MPGALLTAVDSELHHHLIIGSNPLASARCAKSLEVGAKPIVIAPEDSTLHYSLAKRIEDGKVAWVKREFREDDLVTLGREEVDRVVDAVFVTSGGKSDASMFPCGALLESS
jgi:uroporphyrin-III C-methyltransferase